MPNIRRIAPVLSGRVIRRDSGRKLSAVTDVQDSKILIPIHHTYHNLERFHYIIDENRTVA